MSRIAIMTVCYDPYDHTAEVSSEIHHRDLSEHTSRQIYTTHCRNIGDKTSIGWVTLVGVDTLTGVSELVYHKVNPLRERIELNVAAKQIKLIKRVRASPLDVPMADQPPATPTLNSWTHSFPPPSPIVDIEDEDEDKEETLEQHPEGMPF